MTFAIVLVAGAALCVFGLGAAALRRSLIGMLVGVQLAVGGLILLATGLWNLSGTEPSTGQVVAASAVVFAVAAAVLVVALHLATARASLRAEDLEPW
jgi:NADH:ubiquinone oxidoreductase subunit K